LLHLALVRAVAHQQALLLYWKPNFLYQYRHLVPHFGGKLLVELSPTPSASDEVLVSKEKAGAVKAWLEG
jgi:hypothetical protein